MALGSAQAIVDRLTSGGDIIQTGTEFYCLAYTKARADWGEVL
ncbi:hypothetical protein ACFWG6_32775 [Streptomyces erythrochromogenes]